jgi:ribosomal protein S18 acetylase RimI-like enzyme
MASTERPTPVTVRRGETADTPAVAALHASQISEGFLSFVGPRFLTRLYRRIGADPDSFLLVATEQATVVGFVAGSADVGGLYRRFVVRDGVPAAVGSAARLVPKWRQVLETLRHGSSGVGTGHGVELLAIAVADARHGQGTGRQLVTAFLAEVEARGGHSAYVVVGADNVAAVALYRGAGFATAAEVELHAGTASLVMQWEASSGVSR